MAVTFIGLLCMQIFYMHNMLKMRYDQFSVGARRSLTAVSLRLAQDEARYFLEEKVSDVSSSSVYAQYLGAPTLSSVACATASPHRQAWRPTSTSKATPRK